MEHYYHGRVYKYIAKLNLETKSMPQNPIKNRNRRNPSIIKFTETLVYLKVVRTHWKYIQVKWRIIST